MFACGIGLLWLGTVPLTNGLVGQIFGLRYMATLTAIVFFGHQIGSFFGVWLAGYLYDTTGQLLSARSTLSIGLSVFAALINLPVNEKPLAERRKACTGCGLTALSAWSPRLAFVDRGGVLGLPQAGDADRVREPGALLLTA